MEMLDKIAGILREMSQKIHDQADLERDMVEEAFLRGKATGMESVAEQIELLIKARSQDHENIH